MVWQPRTLKDIPKLENSGKSAYVFLIESKVQELLKANSNTVANSILQVCCDNRKLHVQKDLFGKPSVPNSDFYISLSHSGSGLIVALGTVNLGVDIEYLRYPEKWPSVYRWVNRPEDCLVSPSEQDFLACWTAKEALVKVIGSGLDYGMRRLSVPTKISSAYRRISVEGRHYWIKPLPHWKNMTACIAIDELCIVQTYCITDFPAELI